MSTATTTDPRWSPAVRVTFPHVVVSEWRKLTSLRSTWWTLGTALACHAGIGLLMAIYTRVNGHASSPEEATSWAIGATQLTQLAIVVLAVMIITSEYTTGQIRASVAAVPTRLPILVAKAVVLTGAVVVVSVLGVALSMGAGVIIGGDTVAFTLPDSETARILAATPLYLVGIALLTFGVAALIRNTGGTIAIMMAMLLVLQNILVVIPFHLTRLIAPWLPGNAGQLILVDSESLDGWKEAVRPGAFLGAWGGYGVLLAWAALFLVLAGVRLRTRDV